MAMQSPTNPPRTLSVNCATKTAKVTTVRFNFHIHWILLDPFLARGGSFVGSSSHDKISPVDFLMLAF